MKRQSLTTASIYFGSYARFNLGMGNFPVGKMGWTR